MQTPPPLQLEHTSGAYYAYKNLEGSRTPMKDSLGQFLLFTDTVPRTPEIVNQVAESDAYTDKNYNSLINSVDIINHTYDAGTQDIDMDFLNILNDDTIKPDVVAELTRPKSSKRKGLGAASKRIVMKRSREADDDDSTNNYDETESVVVAESDNNYVEEETKPIARTIIKPKTRGRYVKKMCVSSALKPVHVSKPATGDPATETLFRDIIMEQPNDMRPENNRMFASHMLDTSHYMFIVTRPINSEEDTYTLQYINCVHSVYNEYTAHHMHHDRFVLVVTFERYRFLISYHLLLDLGVDIPMQDQFSEKKLADNNKSMCYFEEVKDFEFLSLLTNLFHLDKVYVQGKISLLLASVGEYKARLIHNHLTEMVNDKSLFTLPFHMCKKEANPDELAKYDMSLYVEDIMKATKGLHFKTLPVMDKKYTRSQLVAGIAESLSAWYKNNKELRTGETNNKNNFTYKYGCIARQFYNTNDKGVNKLFKIKKESGSARLVENYLKACRERFENHSFILITTKSDERITIVKMGSEFLWITSVIKDIVVSDIVKNYRMYNHYIFNLNNGNRKEINIRHNGMIKLISYYTGGWLTMDELKSVACTKFQCNFDNLFYAKTKVKEQN